MELLTDMTFGGSSGNITLQNQDFCKRCPFLFLFLTLLTSRLWGCWEYILLYIDLSLMSLVNKMHILSQLHRQYADFSLSSAVTIVLLQFYINVLVFNFYSLTVNHVCLHAKTTKLILAAFLVS